MTIILKVPTINDELTDFDILLYLWRQVNGYSLNVSFDFSQCHFLRQNAVAFLGGLARLIEYRGGTVYFDWDTLSSNIRMNMRQNGFISTFERRGGRWTGNSIPYREDSFEDPVAITNYLSANWLGRGWVSVSPGLQEVIISNVWEIYVNAFEHSQTPVGVFSCGQFYPQLQVLKLTTIDFGVGIPQKIRAQFNNNQILASKAFVWAFTRGTTTRKYAVGGGGLGLDLLKNFIKLNHGKLEIFSNDGYVLIDTNNEIYSNRPSYFEGTIVNITLQCDESYYCLRDENNNEPFF